MKSLKMFADGIPQSVRDQINNLPGAGDTSGAYTNSVLHNVINYILFAVGILAVVMIVVGAIQITTSGGDSGAVAKGKKTLTFAIVGLIVAILAFAIVNFVVGRI